MTNNNNSAHKLNGGPSHTLEARLVAALQDPAISAAELATLVADTEQGLIDATTIADRLQECALDLLQSPDAAKAKEAAEFATLVCKRLENILPRLRSKHQTLVTQQRAARWNTLADMTQANRDTLVAELNEVFPQWVDKIVDFFKRIRAMDQEIDHVNSLAPNSASRRLESLGYQQLLANSKLLALTGETLWPPPPAPIKVNTIVPHISASGDWHETIARRDAERRQQSAKAAQYYHQQARDREEREAAEAKAARERGIP